MKWNKKGHEFDAVFLRISEIKRFYLFGGGDYGTQFFNIMKAEINIVGYIDNAVSKQGSSINGIMCYALENVDLKSDEAIIITMSQIARTRAVQQLIEKGYKKNNQFFIIEDFLSIYHVYMYNRVYLSSVSFLPSTACNLNCRYCLNFNPFAKRSFVREWEDLLKDVDLFFRCVDNVMLFHVSGGEPFLYRRIGDLIEYIDSRYGDRIGTLRTVTNGTIIPSEEVLKKICKTRIEITVDDYREAVPQYNDSFNMLLQKFDEYRIRYYINKTDSWIDLAPEATDYSCKTEEWLEGHRIECNQSWQELRGGKLYSCNYASYATVAGIAGEQDLEETYDLEKHEKKDNKILVEFRLGFTEKGYTNFCKRCRGFSYHNDKVVMPAEQTGDKLIICKSD